MDDKLPALQIYPGDWFRDSGVQSLDYETRGIWWECLLVMHGCKDRGKLVFDSGSAMPDEAIARRLGLASEKWAEVRARLLQYGVASLDDATGALSNRRMVRDEEVRRKKSKAGLAGAEQRWDTEPVSGSNGTSTEVEQNVNRPPSGTPAEGMTETQQNDGKVDNRRMAECQQTPKKNDGRTMAEGVAERWQEGGSSSSVSASVSTSEDGGAGRPAAVAHDGVPDHGPPEHQDIEKCLEAVRDFHAPKDAAKIKAFKDLFRQGVEPGRIVAAFEANPKAKFYAVVDLLSNGKVQVPYRAVPPRPRPGPGDDPEDQRKRAEEAHRARDLVDEKIRTLPPDELESWRREVEEEAKANGWTAFLSPGSMQTGLRLKAAKRFGIGAL